VKRDKEAASIKVQRATCGGNINVGPGGGSKKEAPGELKARSGFVFERIKNPRNALQALSCG
jgi:hypothetical protein